MALKRALAFTALALVVPCVSISAQQAASATNQPTSAELKRLQGTWRGAMVGQEAAGEITLTVTGKSLHFHRDTNFWFEATFSLPGGTNPQQLHATIKGSASSQRDSIGKVVVAILKIEDGTLALTAVGDGEPPNSFEAAEAKALGRYELQKVQPQGQNAQPPKTQ